MKTDDASEMIVWIDPLNTGHNHSSLIKSINIYTTIDLNSMPGLHKIKCISCGTMFMSETNTVEKCPACSEQIQDNMQHGSTSRRRG